MSGVVQQLLKESEVALLSERRTSPRKPFTRPVLIKHGRDKVTPGFSRDISDFGLGVIDQFEWESGTIVDIEIHSLFGRNVSVRAEARWSDNYGEGFFVTGWYFLDG